MPARNICCDQYKFAVGNSHSEDFFGFSQVALKRQQAVEDAIAMRLASNETGKSIEMLPPGKIYGMSVTEPCEAPTIDANVTLVQQIRTNSEECALKLL